MAVSLGMLTCLRSKLGEGYPVNVYYTEQDRCSTEREVCLDQLQQ